MRITGPSYAVKKARLALAELLHLDAARVETVEVPADLMDLIFGQRGERMRRLETAHVGWTSGGCSFTQLPPRARLGVPPPRSACRRWKLREG